MIGDDLSSCPVWPVVVVEFDVVVDEAAAAGLAVCDVGCLLDTLEFLPTDTLVGLWVGADLFVGALLGLWFRSTLSIVSWNLFSLFRAFPAISISGSSESDDS